MQLTDATGQNFGAKVDDKNRLRTFSIVHNQEQHANEDEKAWALGSGALVLTVATEQGVLYIKNGEDEALHIRKVVLSFGVSTGGTTAEYSTLKAYRNPTTGTLISEATPALIKVNRNFGTNDILNALTLVYTGDSSADVTDGSLIGTAFFQPALTAGTVIMECDWILTNNDSVAFTVQPNTTNSSMPVSLTVHAFFNGDS